jgi:NAD(P)-dependent dehydrogenase (short-subunit alcohol dehydrogenase family)
MAIVLITGCSSGIGLVTALRFSRKGDRVFAGVLDMSDVDELQGRAKDEKLPIEVIELDVTDDASVGRAVNHVLASAGRIDVLVNNAGVGCHGPVEDTDDDQAKEVFEINFFGVLRVARAVVPTMREQRSGTIANVSSVNGKIAPPYIGIYAASKHALEAASEALYYELHPFGIRVLLIEPGAFQTRGNESARKARRFTANSPYVDHERRFAEGMTRLPGGSVPGDPQMVAEAIYDAVYTDQPRLRYLVGEDAKMLAGLRRQLDDEQWEQTMRQALDIWD